MCIMRKEQSSSRRENYSGLASRAQLQLISSLCSRPDIAAIAMTPPSEALAYLNSKDDASSLNHLHAHAVEVATPTKNLPGRD